VIDADIQGFFDHVDHEGLLRCLRSRVKDTSLLRLIERFLKAGVREEGEWPETKEGTPQGGILSPILSNIYLHYALDYCWFERRLKGKLRGKAALFR